MILEALSLEPLHGWAISQRIRRVSRDTIDIPQGSLHPALHRLEGRAWVAAAWGTSENNRKAKFYGLTRTGRTRLVAEAGAWARLTKAVAFVLDVG